MLKEASSVEGPAETRYETSRPRASVSLAFKLALLAVAPFVMLSTVLLLGVTYQFERLSEMTIGNQEMEISSPVVQGIEAAVRNAHDSLRAAATRIAELPSWDELSLRQALEREDQLLLFFGEGLLVTDSKHQVLASVGPVRQKREDNLPFLLILIV